jgi:hypothetical protein
VHDLKLRVVDLGEGKFHKTGISGIILDQQNSK